MNSRKQCSSYPDKNTIVLIGYRASGKTTLGKLLAKKLGRDFYDSDAEVEKRSGGTVADIFARSGETEFRRLEKRAIAALSRKRGAVVALGGGAVLNAANLKVFGARAVAVYLKCDAATIAKRMTADPGRPRLTRLPLRAEIEATLRRRLPLYERYADVTVVTTGTSRAGALKKILAGITFPDNPKAGRRARRARGK